MSEPYSGRRSRRARLALARFALRDLRGGLAGLRIFLICIALGVAAIVAVNSLARALNDGLARDGRTILGGDASFSLMHRELSPEERAFLQSRGELSTIATLRAMARNGAGEATLVEVKAVDERLAAARAGGFRARDGAEPGARAARRRATARRSRRRCSIGSVCAIGDVFELGAARFEIRAELVSEPDRLAAGIGLGPRVHRSRRRRSRATRPHPARLARPLDDARGSRRGRRAAERGRRHGVRRCGEGGVPRGGLGDANAIQRLARTFRATSTASANSSRSSG